MHIFAQIGLGILSIDISAQIDYNDAIIRKVVFTMSVKEVVRVLKNAKTIALCWDGSSIFISKDNVLMMDAYGDYLVDNIEAVGGEEGFYQVTIAMRPVKVGEV